MRVSIVDHPLLAATMTTIRDRDTDSPSFTSAVSRAATLLLATATKELPTLAGPVDTPCAPPTAPTWRTTRCWCRCCQAGLGMLAAATDLLPVRRSRWSGCAVMSAPPGPRGTWKRCRPTWAGHPCWWCWNR